MDTSPEQEMKLAELADASGVAPRTIRLYIARGVLPGPLRVGRGAAYGPSHLAALQEIRSLQREGLTLAEIRHRLSATGERPELPGPTQWSQYQLAPDVTVLVSAEASPWRLRRIRAALVDAQEALSAPQEDTRDDHDDST